MSNGQMSQLYDHLDDIHEHFADLYGAEPGEKFAMEIEFKITSDDVLSIKQARPWVFDYERGNTVTTDSPPTADAGTDQTVNKGDTVTLSGTAADPNNDLLTYQWTHDSQLSIAFADDASLSTTFAAPAVTSDTNATFTLTVSDGTHTATDTTVVTIRNNSPPTADAGADQTVSEGDLVTMSGTASDPDGDSLTYQWTHDSGLSITLANDVALSTTFTAPEVTANTTVTFTLTVSEGADSIEDTVSVTISNTGNNPPTVDAGADQIVSEGDTVILSGTAADLDGDSLTYNWTHDSQGLGISLVNDTSLSTTFTAPAVTVDTTVIFTMTVDDGTTPIADAVSVTVQDVPDDSDFVTTWETTTPGESVTIPANGEYTINWGDGSTATQTGNASHVYSAAGTYTVKISGGLTGITLGDNATNAAKLHSIDQWGTVQWDTMEDAFSGASNMAYNATDVPNLSDVASMKGMFRDAASFNGAISGWNVSSVTDMEDMFRDAASFNGAISGWDVSSVTGMKGMFRDAAAFDRPLDSWNVSSVTDMEDMFRDAASFNGAISGWDVSSVTGMKGMFRDAAAFDRPLDSWNVSSVTDMEDMFRDAASFNGAISGWDVSSVTGMKGMFRDAAAFDRPLDSWNVSSVTDMEDMFRDAASFNGAISGWDVSSVTGMKGMFRDAAAFDRPLDSWNVSSVTDMEDMFRDAASFNGAISGWDVSSVTGMKGMFRDAAAFDRPLDSWNVSSVTDMEDMFRDAASFNGAISGWDVSSVTGMKGMFRDAAAFDRPLDSWNVSSVTDMEDMFRDTVFDQNLGNWYIVLDDTAIAYDDAPGIVGGISTQNSFLDGQNPVTA